MKTKILLLLTVFALSISACGPTPTPPPPPQSITGEVVKVEKLGVGVWVAVHANVQVHVTETVGYDSLVGKNVIMRLGSGALVLNKGDTITVTNCYETSNGYSCDLSPIIEPAK